MTGLILYHIFVLSFSSQLKPETIAERLNKKSSEIDLRHQIDALCVLDRGVSLVNCTRNRLCKPKGGNYVSGWVALKTGEATLLEFVRNCIDYVPRIRYPHPPIAKYFPESPGYKYIGGGKRPHAVHYSRGVVKYNSGQYKEAIIDFNNAIKLKPDSAEAYYSRGNTRNKLNQDEREEIIDFTKAIELKPDFIEAYLNRGFARCKLNQYEKAIEDYNKAIELRPDLELKLRPIITELKSQNLTSE